LVKEDYILDMVDSGKIIIDMVLKVAEIEGVDLD